DAKVDVALLQLGGKAAVLRTALLGDVHSSEDLEDVEHRVPHHPIERLGGIHHAVDAQPDGHFVFFGLDMDVRAAAQDRVVNQLLGGEKTLRVFHLPRFSAVPAAGDVRFSNERNRRADAKI